MDNGYAIYVRPVLLFFIYIIMGKLRQVKHRTVKTVININFINDVKVFIVRKSYVYLQI